MTGPVIHHMFQKIQGVPLWRPIGSALAALCCTVLPAACMGPSSLFDGYSLEGWQSTGAAVWSVRNGEIIASGAGDGFLVSAGQYGDFHLRVEFWIDAATNSGIFIRCRDRASIDPGTCYESNIWDQHPDQAARTGAIVQRYMPPRVRVDTVGRWSIMEIIARGARVEVRVDGVTTALLEDADPAPGFIALQHWGEGTVIFRTVELYLS